MTRQDVAVRRRPPRQTRIGCRHNRILFRVNLDPRQTAWKCIEILGLHRPLLETTRHWHRFRTPTSRRRITHACQKEKDFAPPNLGRGSEPPAFLAAWRPGPSPEKVRARRARERSLKCQNCPCP